MGNVSEDQDQTVAQNSIILEPDWVAIRAWVRHVAKTDLKYARQVNATLNRERTILEVTDIPNRVREAFSEFPSHGHWHDLADLAYGFLDNNGRLADECATHWAKHILGIDVEADPIERGKW